MTKREVLKLNECKIESVKYKYVKICVYLVQKCNFNDEFLVENVTVNLQDIKNKPLKFYDAFLGKLGGNTKQVAIAYVNDKKLYLIEKEGKNVKVIEGNVFSVFTEDYDERLIISTHINTTNFAL